jgi:Protein of unknown function (DUF3828)
MRNLLLLLAASCNATIIIGAEMSPKAIVTQLYQAHRSKHDPLQETELLGRYFDPLLLKLYLKDKREAKGEVGRLDGDPLYHAQEVELANFSVSKAENVGTETRVTVRFKNLGKSVRLVYVLTQTPDGWRISDIRYNDGSSLKKILQAPL